MTQPAHRARSTVTRPAKTLLVPVGLRRDATLIHAHVDFLLPPADAARFRHLLPAACRKGKGRVAASASTDTETALLVVRVGTHYSAIIDYRKGARSPYPKISPRVFRAFVEFINKKAQSMCLTYWRQTLRLSQGKAEGPNLRAIVERLTKMDLSIGTKEAAVLTGFEFGSRGKDWGVFLSWANTELFTVSAWNKGRREVSSLGDGLNRIPLVLSEML